jgi:hypothetical protein
MNFLEIMGLIFVSMFGLAFIGAFIFFWIPEIKDFFYGLFTWQKKVPVYRDIGNNQFSNVFAAMFPVDHYEWVKRGTLKEEIKEWFNKKKYHG